MNPNKTLWEKGDFTQIAQSMRDSGEELVAGISSANGSTSMPAKYLRVEGTV